MGFRKNRTFAIFRPSICWKSEIPKEKLRKHERLGDGAEWQKKLNEENQLMRNYEIYEMKEGKRTRVRPGDKGNRRKSGWHQKVRKTRKEERTGGVFAEFDRYETKKKWGRSSEKTGRLGQGAEKVQGGEGKGEIVRQNCLDWGWTQTDTTQLRKKAMSLSYLRTSEWNKFIFPLGSLVLPIL